MIDPEGEDLEFEGQTFETFEALAEHVLSTVLLVVDMMNLRLDIAQFERTGELR